MHRVKRRKIIQPKVLMNTLYGFTHHYNKKSDKVFTKLIQTFTIKKSKKIK